MPAISRACWSPVNQVSGRRVLAQVLKNSLSLVEPTVRTDAGFEYEEGEGLDEDEVAVNKAKLPLPLNQQAGHCHPLDEQMKTAVHAQHLPLHPREGAFAGHETKSTAT